MTWHIHRSGSRTRGFALTAIAAIAAATAFALLAAPPAARAAQFSYGSFGGTDYTFANVAESSGEAAALFGAPIVSGNSLDFNPLGYSASSANGDTDSTIGNLVLGITAKKKKGPNASGIGSISLAETGDTTLLGNVTPGSMETASAVFASGVLDIHEVDGEPINQISVPFSFTFNPSGGTYFLGTDGGGGPIFNTQFSGSVSLPVEQILIANGVTGSATHVSLDLNNGLHAVTQAGTSAFIAKVDFGLVVNNPEPTALSGMAALLALALARRRGLER
jgi:hypothetical protein